MKQLFLFAILITSLSCSKPDPAQPATTIDKTDVQLHYDETYQYSLLQGSSSVTPSSYSWSSSNTAVGTISSAGKFTAKHIGETTITGTSSDKATTVQSKVTVTPYSTAWAEPILNFNASSATIKAAEKRTILDEKAGASLAYKGENAKIRGLIYLFTSDKMTSATTLPENTTAIAAESVTFLKERYDYAGVTTDQIYTFTDNKTVAVGLSADDQIGLMITYIPYSKPGRLPSEQIITTVSSAIGKIKSSTGFFRNGTNTPALSTELKRILE